VPASWVTADEVDGGDPAPRVWLEDRGMPYVLAVKGTEPLVRRRRDGELASACLGPASTSLVGLVRMAGSRWAIEEALPTGQDRGRPGPRRGAPLAGLVPAHHLGPAGACLPGRHPHQGRRPHNGDAAA
jgi:hypothetical protein